MNQGKCIHFNGIFWHPCCKAGVNYHDAFDGKKPGIFLRMPCIQRHETPVHGKGTYIRFGEPSILDDVDRRGEVMTPCSLYQEPTQDQIDQYRKEMDARWGKTLAANKVAAEWRVVPKPSADRVDVVDCPVCKGRLHLSQSSYNGYVDGKCETDGCVAWME